MITTQFINRWRSYPGLAALAYFAFSIVLCLATSLAMLDLVQQYRARAAALEMLARFAERQRSVPSETRRLNRPRPAGSPFLEGQTETVASATLLQRVTNAITRAGGSVVSTEVDSSSTGSNGYVKVVVTGQLDQLALQKVLYDIEAGMPFLFVDQLAVSQPTPTSENGPMRVTLGISGNWLKGK